ncbi:hypothetical protein M0802_004946 [Mischocyttarus mexicanus]|nr:hypothetical protein M0802_004946 [Mischocyttarus mexicanus]
MSKLGVINIKHPGRQAGRQAGKQSGKQPSKQATKQPKLVGRVRPGREEDRGEICVLRPEEKAPELIRMRIDVGVDVPWLVTEQR